MRLKRDAILGLPERFRRWLVLNQTLTPSSPYILNKWYSLESHMSKTWFRLVFKSFLGLKNWLGPVLGTLLGLKTWLGPVPVSSYGPAALLWETITFSELLWLVARLRTDLLRYQDWPQHLQVQQLFEMYYPWCVNAQRVCNKKVTFSVQLRNS